jgi:hypothetical protein
MVREAGLRKRRISAARMVARDPLRKAASLDHLTFGS